MSFAANAGFPASSLTATQAAGGAGFGDVDGDGDADLVIANNGANTLLLNDGLGNFRSSPTWGAQADSVVTKALALGDVNGDGTLDLILANRMRSTGSAWAGANQLLTNNGSGIFVSGLFPGSSALTNALALGDVNGDGALDLVLGNSGLDELFINNGSGTFSRSLTFVGDSSSTTTAVCLGDVDGDGALDIVFGKNTADNIGGAEVLFGDGAGGFRLQLLQACEHRLCNLLHVIMGLLDLWCRGQLS